MLVQGIVGEAKIWENSSALLLDLTAAKMIFSPIDNKITICMLPVKS